MKRIILAAEVPDDDTAKLDGVLFTDGEFRINRYAEIIPRPTDEEIEDVQDVGFPNYNWLFGYGVKWLRSQIWGDAE